MFVHRQIATHIHCVWMDGCDCDVNDYNLIHVGCECESVCVIVSGVEWSE